MKNERVYSPSDIKAYQPENDKYYVSKDVTVDSVKQKVFLEFLVEGFVNLYYFKDIQKEYFFLEKEFKLIPLSNDESIITVKEKSAMGDGIET